MKRTIGGALKAVLEPQFTVNPSGNALTVYRIRHPEADVMLRKYPYAVVHEGISVTPNALDNPDAHDDPGVDEQAQVDLWQMWKDANDQEIEDPGLPDAFHVAMHGINLPLAPNRVYGCRVINRIRLDDEDTNLIRHSYTIELARNLARLP